MNDLPKRKQIRLKDYDYSQNGYYFITICSKQRQCLFGSIVGADTIRPQLNECGNHIKKSILEINNRYKNVFVDKYVIMPNHIHMILVIAGADTIRPETNDGNATDGQNEKNGRIISAPTVSVIIGQMKRWVSKNIGFSCWQKSFYEHIIRNEQAYQKICEYIENNPKKWEDDKYHEQ